jgi:two-component system response regulator (stage 0 sporulation protein F)
MKHAIVGRLCQNVPQTASRHRVLIVDDDRLILKLFTDFFESEMPGYAVTTASSGEAGLEAFLAETPDVVLLDVNMPGMDGLNVLKAIRGLDRSVPVIMVTGATQSEPAEALKNGALAYLPKPFDFCYVRLLVVMATERRGASRALGTERPLPSTAVSRS